MTKETLSPDTHKKYMLGRDPDRSIGIRERTLDPFVTCYVLSRYNNQIYIDRDPDHGVGTCFVN